MTVVDPTTALIADRQQARDRGDSNAELCWLATTDDAGWPQVRALVLRDVDDGHALFINATSAKGAQIAREPRCQIACWYPSLQRQWRLSARLSPLPRPILARHWQRRPRSSQVLDHVYAEDFPQSSLLDAPSLLEAAHERMDARLGSDPVPPEQALALSIEVLAADCLQIHAGSRLHERWRFRPTESGWQRTPVVP